MTKQYEVIPIAAGQNRSIQLTRKHGISHPGKSPQILCFSTSWHSVLTFHTKQTLIIVNTYISHSSLTFTFIKIFFKLLICTGLGTNSNFYASLGQRSCLVALEQAKSWSISTPFHKGQLVEVAHKHISSSKEALSPPGKGLPVLCSISDQWSHPGFCHRENP